MSYFYKIPITSTDSRNPKKKHKRHRKKVTTKVSELGLVQDSCHRQHSSKIRSLKSKSMLVDDDPNSRSISLPKSKLSNDNEKSISKLRTTPESALSFIELLSEKENELIKYKNRYNKLEKSYKEYETEKLRLIEQLKKRENEYLEMHFRYQELVQEKAVFFSELDKSKTENLRFNEDLSLLKILVYKLNVEIQKYQDKLRQRNDQVDVDQQNSDKACERKKVFESWGKVSNHVLSPLLDAYQEKLEEKEQLIKKYRQEIDHIGGRCKEVVVENDDFRRGIDQYKLQLEQMAVEFQTTSDDASLVKKENVILSRQQSLHQHKLHEIHSVYEKKVELMSKDYNKLQSDCLACKIELSNLQGKYEVLNDNYEKIKKNSEKTMPVFVHNQAIEECKKLLEELKCQYDTEKRKLLDQLKKHEENDPGDGKVLAITTAERDQLRQQIKNLEQKLKRTEWKLACLQSTVCSIQVSRDSFKRQVTRLVIEQENLLTERKELMIILHGHQKDNENIQNIGDDIVQRMGSLKNQLKWVQKGAKEQLKNVEKHIKCQEHDVGQMKTDYNHELQRLKQLIKHKEAVIGRLQKDKLSIHDNLKLTWKTTTNDDKNVKDNLKNTKVYNV